jgi:3-mercaptopropionate dioxygenase
MTGQRGGRTVSDDTLGAFVSECRRRIADCASPADCVEAVAPCMLRLLHGDRAFLGPGHLRTDPDHYARNLVHLTEDGLLSLYALVWLPGQWTPIHDHGTWGVVGVVEGVLQERSFIRTDDGPKGGLEGIELARGGVVLLSPGTVTSFVPNPDHIHITGNPQESPRVVSLHLYGRAMSGFHVYDRTARTRSWVEVSHNES